MVLDREESSAPATTASSASAAASSNAAGTSTSAGSSTASAGGVGGGEGASGGGGGGGGSGGAAQQGGADGSGGAGGSSPLGACGDGGVADYEPVPGCERLVWVGELLAIADDVVATPRVATLDDGDVGLLHVQGLEGPVLTRRIEKPFDAWPPAIGEPQVFRDVHAANVVPILSARGDGVFATFGGVGTFGHAGVTLELESDRLFVDPRASAGGYRAEYFGSEISFLASIDGDGEGPVVHTGAPDCHTPEGFVTSDGELLLTYSPVDYLAGLPECQPLPTQAQLARVDPVGGVSLPTIDLGWRTIGNQLVAREQGAWLVSFRGSLPWDFCAIPIDLEGRPTAPPFDGPATTSYESHFERWRDGFAFPVPWEGAYRFAVSDGERMTVSEDGPIAHVSSSFPAEIAASHDGSSLLVAFGGYAAEGGSGLYVGRLDCAPAE